VRRFASYPASSGRCSKCEHEATEAATVGHNLSAANARYRELTPSKGLSFDLQGRYDVVPTSRAEEVKPMEYDMDKIDEAILALLGALEFDNGRVWKRLNFDAMDRLHANGLISDPKGRAESVYLTETGMRQAKALASKYFAKVPA